MTRRGPKGSRPTTRKGEAPPAPAWSNEDPNLEFERSRYADPIASRELILKHLAEAPEPLTAARLAKRLGLDTDTQRNALTKRLAAMVRDGQAISGPNGYGAAGEGERVAGRIKGRANGDVLVLPDDGSAPLQLARADTATLMQSDRVEVLAVGVNDRGRRVARLIRRTGSGPVRVGGILSLNHPSGRLEPEDPGHWYSIEVAQADAQSARSGDSVIVEIVKRPQGELGAQGRVVEVLRDLRPADLAARFAILRHELPQEFPADVLHAANLFKPDVLPSDFAGREDLRDLPLVTIDGADSRDFDDAVFAEKVRWSGWRVVVAIADVSYYVRPGTALDTEARARATSVYFPDRVIPMLPEHLSNHLCSLNPNVERLAFVCDMRIGKNGKLGKAKFYEAVIRSKARLTYHAVWSYLEAPKGPAANSLAPDVRKSLSTLYDVYNALKIARDGRGALDFRGGETKAHIGNAGTIDGFYGVQRNDAHRLIEECMIAANVQAAIALRLAKAKSLYRVHGQPEDKRVTELQKVLGAMQVGAQFSEKPTPREFRQLVDRLAGHPHGALLETQVIRSLAQAVYQQTNIGHFGLALDEYAHFTSPIRRYPDLVVHRALKGAVVKKATSGYVYSAGELEALGAETSQRERRADDASRDVMSYLKCLYLQPRVGETFEATITSALEFGLFVVLKEVPIDGLVHISQIPGDYWELENGGMGLVGQRTGKRWQLGDTVNVRLSRVDLTQRQIDFELLSADGASSQGTVRSPRRGGHEQPRRDSGGSRDSGGNRNSGRRGGRGGRSRRG